MCVWLTNSLEHRPSWEAISSSACHLLACWIFAELISSTLKMEAICSSEMSVETRRTTRRHIPEGDTLHNHRCENLKSYSSSAILAIPSILWKQKVYRRVHKNPPLIRILNQSTSSYSFKIPFIIFLPSTPKSSSLYLSFRLSYLNTVQIYFPAHTYYNQTPILSSLISSP
jgi:hypothetical protein